MSENLPSSRQELEAKVTALLLGELSADEAATLRQAMGRDAELAKLHERLKLAADLVHETVHSPAAQTEAQPAPLKLSEDRRQKLLAQFKTVSPKEFQRAGRQRARWMMPLSVAASLVLLIGLVALLSPRLASRSKQFAATDRLRLPEGALFSEEGLDHREAAQADKTVAPEKNIKLFSADYTTPSDTVQAGKTHPRVVSMHIPPSEAAATEAKSSATWKNSASSGELARERLNDQMPESGKPENAKRLPQMAITLPSSETPPPVTLNYITSDGNAVAGMNFQGSEGTLSFEKDKEVALKGALLPGQDQRKLAEENDSLFSSSKNEVLERARNNTLTLGSGIGMQGTTTPAYAGQASLADLKNNLNHVSGVSPDSQRSAATTTFNATAGLFELRAAHGAEETTIFDNTGAPIVWGPSDSGAWQTTPGRPSGSSEIVALTPPPPPAAVTATPPTVAPATGQELAENQSGFREGGGAGGGFGGASMGNMGMGGGPGGGAGGGGAAGRGRSGGRGGRGGGASAAGGAAAPGAATAAPTSDTIIFDSDARLREASPLESAAQIAGSGALTKSGDGTLALTGVNSFSGGTIVNSGALVQNGSYGSYTWNGGTLTINQPGSLAQAGSQPAEGWASAADWDANVDATKNANKPLSISESLRGYYDDNASGLNGRIPVAPAKDVIAFNNDVGHALDGGLAWIGQDEAKKYDVSGNIQGEANRHGEEQKAKAVEAGDGKDGRGVPIQLPGMSGDINATLSSALTQRQSGNATARIGNSSDFVSGGMGGGAGMGGLGGLTGGGGSARRSSSSLTYASPGTVGDAVFSINPDTHSTVVLADSSTQEQIKQVIGRLEDRAKADVGGQLMNGRDGKFETSHGFDVANAEPQDATKALKDIFDKNGKLAGNVDEPLEKKLSPAGPAAVVLPGGSSDGVETAGLRNNVTLGVNNGSSSQIATVVATNGIIVGYNGYDGKFVNTTPLSTFSTVGGATTGKKELPVTANAPYDVKWGANAQPVSPTTRADAPGLRMNFANAPLDTVLNYLSSSAGFNVVKEVQSTARLNLAGVQPASKDEAVDMVNSELYKNGLALVRNGQTLTVVSLNEAKTRGIPVSLWNGDPNSIPKSDTVVTMVLPVRSVPVAGLLQNLRPLVSSTTPLTANQAGNSIIITDTQANIRRVAEVIKAREPGSSADIAPPKPPAGAPIPQPEIQTRDNAFSTFSLNVSDVSFRLAAASLEKGLMPEPASIRTEEFINAFDYRDSEAAPGAPIAFAWERAHDPFAYNRDLLRFSVKTAAEGRQAGRPLNIVLLLDNSGSMERADRVAIIREALRVLATQLHPQDKLSVVLFARTARLWVDGVSGDQAARVAQEVSGLTPQGGTNLEEAMKLAYEAALRHYLANGMNRVVLLTDGAANLGTVQPEVLKQMVDAHRKQGIALDCFGIGWEGYNDDLLEVLTRNGNGRYGFVNTPAEAASEFAVQLAGALHVAASDVKVQVEFNPARVTSYRQLGYAKHQLTKEQFRDNTVAAAEIAAQEAGNAMYVVEVNPAGEGPVATVRVRYRTPGTSQYFEHEWSVPYTGNAVGLEQASAAMKLAGTASAFSEWLAGSPYAGEVTTDRLLGCLRGVPEVFGVDARPRKLQTMVMQAKSISGR